MLIQKIIFPREEICNEWKMYFQSKIPGNWGGAIDDRNDDLYVIQRMKNNGRKAGNVIEYDANKEVISAKKGAIISFESYFNAFSVGKWNKYSTIGDLSIRLDIKGDANIRVFHAVGSVDDIVNDPKCNGGIMNKVKYDGLHVTRKRIDKECSIKKDGNGYIIKINKIYSEGIIYPVIKAESDIEIMGGGYETKTSPNQKVNIALGICTFKREDYVTSNVGKVIRDIVASKESPLRDNLEVYVSDNGQTLSMSDFESAYKELVGAKKTNLELDKKIHLFKNMNAGGAGGFTRTMIEALMKRSRNQFSHIILMDDDIVLDCRVIERTYNFLRFLKEEYQDSMIGGEMFELDYRFIQFEAGATFGGIEVKFYNKNWDMRLRDTVSCNEVENPINYSGWWYSVIPSSIVKEDNLPIPLFIHYDDIEYGIRNDYNGTILLNGICVWHPQGVNKAPISMNYYDVRNMLIANVGRKDELSASDLIYHMKNRVVGDVIRYRYDAAERVFEAIDDFYKGPKFFMKLNPIENHKKMMDGNYKFKTPEELEMNLDELQSVKDDSIPRWWYVWDALCWALPTVKEVRVSSIRDHGLPFMARSIYFYDEDKKAGYYVERNYKRAFECVIRFFRTAAMIRRKHKSVMKMWAKAKKNYTSRKYWEKYLDIK